MSRTEKVTDFERNSAPRVPLQYHPAFAGYDFGPGHPFRGERFTSFMAALRNHPRLYSRLEIVTPVPAADELLLLAHSASYIRMVHELEDRRGFLSIDTQVLPGSVDAARLIVGASVAAVDTARENGLALGFGGLHHAGRDFGEGFCIFNDVAVAARHLLESGIERVMIIDTDAHQGNGTMDIFYEDPRVLFVSLHQDPRTLYPGTGFVSQIGNGPGTGYTVNIPMPPGAGDGDYRYALDQIVLPLIGRFAPGFIIRNGGSDPLAGDALTNLGLTLEGLSMMTGVIAAAARERRIPLADLFLSGYGSHVTEGWLAILRGTLDEPIEIAIAEEPAYPARRSEARIRDVLHATIEQLHQTLRPVWGEL